MNEEAIANLALIKQVVLVLFTTIFVVVLLRLLWSRSDRYRRAAQIPLHEEVVDSRTTTGSQPVEGARDV